uniref:Rad60/SUMO-like domain-containing protein n=1 Tax=Timema monikensis TaxID=170555 RepID=A0A7R9DXL3_9NEOP|nr:unnamed protein product [Timema monikensis]
MAVRDITSSDSLKNRLRSRKKKQIIVDTVDLTDEVSLPVKPSPVIIDNLTEARRHPQAPTKELHRRLGQSWTLTHCELKVQRKGVKRPMMVRIKKTDQMVVLMVQCAEQLNLPLDKLKFSFDGEDVNKSDTPAYLELEGGECVDLFVSS